MSGARTVVLVGAGHAHLYLAARAKTLTRHNARVILVDPGRFWYSGLATGMLGGAYSAAEDQVDPEALIVANGGRFIRSRVEAVDAAARRLHLASGEALRYDWLSLNVGSRVDTSLVAGACEDGSVYPVKPISNLWSLRRHLEARFAAGESPRVAVVGGGPTGSEVAANIRALATRWRAGAPVSVITRGDRLLPRMPAGAARVLTRTLTDRGVNIRTRTKITRRESNALATEAGDYIGAEIVALATGLKTNPLIHATGLPSHGDGLRVDGRLQSIADERVFAAGDCASVEGFDLPMLGVVGVRQAASVHRNVLAQVHGRRSTVYRPQRRYLTILNLGDRRALAVWGPLWWRGRTSMRLKDAIDRRFLEAYRRAGSSPKRGCRQ